MGWCSIFLFVLVKIHQKFSTTTDTTYHFPQRNSDNAHHPSGLLLWLYDFQVLVQ